MNAHASAPAFDKIEQISIGRFSGLTTQPVLGKGMLP
jgi:hypothetical protein